MPSLQLSVPGQETTSSILLGVGRAHAEFVQLFPDGVNGVVGDPAEDDVLLRRGAGAFAPVLAEDVGEAAELLGGEVALVDGGFDGGVAVLDLGSDVGVEEAFEAGGIAVWRGQFDGDVAGVGVFVVEVEQFLERRRLGGPAFLQFVVDHLAEGLFADPVDEELEAGLEDVLAQFVGGVEDPDHGLGEGEELRHRDELGQRDGFLGHGGESAADHDAEAADLFAVDHADLGEEGEVVDGGDGGVGLASGEVDLELAGQELGDRVPYPVADEGAGVGRGVEHFVVGDAGPGVGGDIADGVAAGLARGESDVAEHAEHVGHLVERDEVHLDVLARSDVAFAQGGEGHADFGEAVELIGGDAAHGQLDPVHVNVGLPLSVDALAQAVEHELHLLALLLAERGRFGLEIVEFVVPDRDHDSGRVGSGLGHTVVLQLCWSGFHLSSAGSICTGRGPRPAAARARIWERESRASEVRCPEAMTWRKSGSASGAGGSAKRVNQVAVGESPDLLSMSDAGLAG